jgi:tRNA-2-methylthio-N6-dimethylallyladenosine synthase
MESKENYPHKKKVFVKTFGCQMNEYDTEKMLMLLSSDYERVETAEEADLAIVNTCSVREKGEHKLYGLLGRLRQLKESKPSMVIGVGGCVAQQEGEAIIKRSPSVDFVVGTHNLSLVPSLVHRIQDHKGPQVAIDYRDEWDELPDEFDVLPSSSSIVPSAFSSPVRALVAIQRGCDKMCAYCVVPTTRGPQVSRDLHEILKEIRLKIRMGAKEVMLLGQTVNSYGLDLHQRVSFAELVRRVSEIEGVERIRFTSPHPAEVKKDFINLFGEIPGLCPHIHLPLQSGSNKILKNMNRNYKKERYLAIVDSLREQIPSIAISTDIIVGFPGETDEDFQETMDMITQVRYHTCFSFKYSIRPNTKAKQEFSESDEIPEAIKKDRLTRLQRAQELISFELNQEFLEKDIEILVESPAKGLFSYYGRSAHNIPVELVGYSGEEITVGQIVKGVVARATPHGLRALSEMAYELNKKEELLS